MLSGIAVAVALWSLMAVRGEAMIAWLAGTTWVLLALLIFLYGWRDYRHAQGRDWRPVAEIASWFR